MDKTRVPVILGPEKPTTWQAIFDGPLPDFVAPDTVLHVTLPSAFWLAAVGQPGIWVWPDGVVSTRTYRVFLVRRGSVGEELSVDLGQTWFPWHEPVQREFVPDDDSEEIAGFIVAACVALLVLWKGRP